MVQISDTLLKDYGYLYQSFAVYGGEKGLYDYGPVGTTLKANIIDYWRKVFVFGEQNFEIDATMLTPEAVFA